MMEIFKHLPHLEAYGNPQYFLYLLVAVLPIFIGLFFKKRFPMYEILVSLLFIVLMLTGKTPHQLISLACYVAWQSGLVWSYKNYRRSANTNWFFYVWVFLAIIPLAFVKISPLLTNQEQASLWFSRNFLSDFQSSWHDYGNA